MAKVVVLRLDGSIQQGVHVTLEIGTDSQRPDIELQGSLPPCPNLEAWLAHWQSIYRSLEIPTRLKPQKVVYGNLLPELLEKCIQAAEKIGYYLREWLETREFATLDKRLRAALSTNEHIRVLVKTENTQLIRLPWHLWDFFESYKQAGIAFSTPNYSRVKPAKPKTIKNKANILAILGDSNGINLNEDCNSLSNLPGAEIKLLVEPRRKELGDQLWSKPWDILFFAGHSKTQENSGYLYINESETLAISDLKNSLTQSINQGLQLAIFNSCDGLGLARDLGKLNIPQMIVMHEPIPDRVAHEFLKNFLQTFSRGESLYSSVRTSRERLETVEDQYPCATWLPVILQNPAETPPLWKDFCNLDAQSTLNFTSTPIAHSNRSSVALSGRTSTKQNLAPDFSIESIKPIAEVFCPSTEKAIGQAKEIINPGHCGQVKFSGSFWSACHYPDKQNPECWRTIALNEQVKIVGLINNKLVVTPKNYVLPSEKTKTSVASMLSWLNLG